MNGVSDTSFAKSVTIARVKAQLNPSHNDSKHLTEHFANSKDLVVGEIFSLYICDPPPDIEPNIWREYCDMCNLDMKTRHVQFKVIKAVGHDNEDIVSDFKINSSETTLYQIADVGSYIPSFLKFPELWTFYENESEFVKGILEGGLRDRGSFPILLSGIVGSRKDDFVSNVASVLGLSLFKVRGVSYCGETAGALETKFTLVCDQVKSFTPCLLYIDHLELLGRTRDGLNNEPRVLHAIRSLFTSLECMECSQCCIVGSCSEIGDVLDEIKDVFCTEVILKKRSGSQITNYLKYFLNLDQEVEEQIAAKLARYTIRTIDKVVERLKSLDNPGCDEWRTILEELEGTDKLSMIPETSWDDIGGVDHVRQEIHDTIEMPLLYPDLFNGCIKRSGLLLYGKPGCGKTMVARAIASQCQLHFISIQGPELLNSFVGQSEKNVRDIFDEARAMAPTVLFFDEIDAIAPVRSGGVIDRVLSQLLSEMDGIEESENVFVIGATNRPELLDPGLTRPGRLDRRVEVCVGEDVGSRVQVFKALSRKLSLSHDVSLEHIAQSTGPLSGAQCYALILNACYQAVERCVEECRDELVISQKDLMNSV